MMNNLYVQMSKGPFHMSVTINVFKAYITIKWNSFKVTYTNVEIMYKIIPKCSLNVINAMRINLQKRFHGKEIII